MILIKLQHVASRFKNVFIFRDHIKSIMKFLFLLYKLGRLMQRTFEQIAALLNTCKVGIAGAGGLGSNCAVALSRIGIGELVIADFDVVNAGNLNRQYFFRDQIGKKKVFALRDNIQRINPDCQVFAHDLKICEEHVFPLFSGCDVIVEAFDAADQKKMLVEACITRLPNIPLVCGSGLAGYGSNNSITTQQWGNIYICGDQNNEVSETLPPMAPRVGIVANMQANQVVEILLQNK